MPQHMEDLVRNKKSICWDCNEPVAIMDEVNWKDTHPTCDSCRAIRATQNRSSEIRVDKSSLEDYVKILEKRKEDEKLEDIPGL